MASFNFSIPKELQNQLAKIANIDEVAPKMIDAAAPIVVESIKKRTPVKTGALKNSVKAKSAKPTKTGAYIGNINFDGIDKKEYKNGDTVSVPNALKAQVLEYGRKGKNKHPFITPAVKDSEKEAVEKMQAVFEELTKE